MSRLAQRSHIEGSQMKYLTAALVVIALYACSPNPCYHANDCRRIDWSAVPEVGPYKAPAAPTPTQRALKRGAHAEYMALQFEREKH